MNKYTVMLAFLTVFLIRVISGVLTYTNEFTKGVLSRVGMSHVLGDLIMIDANNRFSSDSWFTSELFMFLVLLRDKNGYDESRAIAGEFLSRHIPALERAISDGDPIQRNRAKQLLATIASDVVSAGHDASNIDIAEFIDQESLKVLSRYVGESSEKRE